MTLWRVATTYDVFSHTVDEPTHIADGMQFFEKGRASGDVKHSPLARIAVAIGPELLARDARLACKIDHEEKLARCEGERYWRTLTAARLGTLPFLVLMLATVWAWGTWSGGPLTGFAAALLLANAPPVLAHAGLATTDAAGTATLVLALFLFVLWLDRPTVLRSLGLGVAAALALGTKLSAAVFLPAAGLAMLIAHLCRRGRQPLATGPAGLAGQLGAALIAGIVVLWAIYGFTLNPVVGPGGLVADDARAPLALLKWKLFPLVEMMRGIEQLGEMNARGVQTYFVGEIRQSGWWYFFPVMFAVKTPLPFLALLACAGAVRSWATKPAVLAAAAAAAILAVSMTSRINIGLRHVLVIYPLASIVAGAGAAALLGSGGRAVGRGLALLLIGWLLLDVALTHPDYLAYFNEAARADAAYFSADSDFDWGQDAKRLADELSRRRIDRVAVAMNSSNVKLADLALVKAAELWPDRPASGWVAAGIGRILDDRIRPPYLGLRWLECYRPVALIGRTILLYYIAPGAARVGETGCGLSNLVAPNR